jgi:hypothetical protein
MTSATPARFEHAVHLVERLERAREILKRCAADDEIELVGGEGQVGGVVLEVDTDARFARIFVGDAHEGVAGIEPDDAAASERGDFDGEIAGPGRDFEHAGARADMRRNSPGSGFKLFDVAGGLARVPLGDEAFHPDALLGVFGRFGHRCAPFLSFGSMCEG